MVLDGRDEWLVAARFAIAFRQYVNAFQIVFAELIREGTPSYQPKIATSAVEKARAGFVAPHSGSKDCPRRADGGG
jgi:hypothetical protein